MLAGKVIAVTGGTGALGGAVVGGLLDAGAGVAVVGGQVEKVAALVADLAAGARAAGERVAGFAADLTDEEQVASAFAGAVGHFGGLDGLAALAGGYAGGTPVGETELATWRGQQDLNLTTAFLCCRAAVPHLAARGGGAIVTVGSRPALHGAPSVAAYSAAKAGVLRLTEALAAELGDQNIAVNCILPGVIDTPANRAAMPRARHDRWVAPDAIAAVVRWLLGPEARIVSGAAIPVYGRS
ncbi:MAG TPA: SDR family NAD(P)-dependent oxidoreductase [Thermomicrobiales bacterium]|nr:SDR family NAD(P)-dependent oxidoreductase [Thermomicrobiales bacterium]